MRTSLLLRVGHVGRGQGQGQGRHHLNKPKSYTIASGSTALAAFNLVLTLKPPQLIMSMPHAHTYCPHNRDKANSTGKHGL